MNTGFLGPAVATVLTVYGIETFCNFRYWTAIVMLQQYLPFTVLKPWTYQAQTSYMSLSCNSTYRLRY